MFKTIWKSIYQFGLPECIISNNERQFDNRRFQELCSNLHIEQRFISIRHPQSNEEVEVTNRIILQGLKSKLNKAKDLWVDELDNVLWSYQTTWATAGEIPFKLTFRTKAVIPLEIDLVSNWIKRNDKRTNQERLRASLDFLEQVWKKANIKMTAYK